MNKIIYALACLSCLLILSAGAPAVADEEVRPDNAQKCISTRTLTGTRILDDQNVLFYKQGRTIYHNILPKRCAGLARAGIFSYGALAGSICSRDVIRIIEDNSGLPGRGCTLGYFLKITKEDIPAIFESRNRPIESAPLPPAEVEDVTDEDDDRPD